jgi:hypothetical protein
MKFSEIEGVKVSDNYLVQFEVDCKQKPALNEKFQHNAGVDLMDFMRMLYRINLKEATVEYGKKNAKIVSGKDQYSVTFK